MVKHAVNKKRRAGRTGKTKLKNGTYAKFKPVKNKDKAIRDNWNPTSSPMTNMSNLGLVAMPNLQVNSRGLTLPVTHTENSNLNSKAVELFDIPDSDVIPKKTRSMIMLPLSIEKQEYMARCMTKHSDNYLKIFRDIKVNDMQYTENQLKKMGSRFLLLTESQRRVDVPEKVEHLIPAS